MSSRICPACSKKFDTRRGVAIHYAQKHDGSIAGVELKCSQCAKPFRKKPSHITERNFCSRECFYEWRWSHYNPEDHPSWAGGPVTVECSNCKAEFDVKRYRLERSENLFCSMECAGQWRSKYMTGENASAWKGGLIEISCSYCGKKKRIKRYRYKAYERNFCGQQCKAEWQRRNLTGKDNPHWLGGAEGYFSWQIEAEGDWDINKDRALKRDNYTCLLCRADAESLGRNPDVHHIIPLRNGGTNLLRNLACLCRSCHQQIEGKTVRRLGLNQRASDEEAAQVRGWFWDKVNLDTIT